MVGRQVAWSPYNFASDDEAAAGTPMSTSRPRALVRRPRRAHAAERQGLKLSDNVVRALAERIVNGAIGAEVPAPTERDICEEFSVSKTTAREVIGALASRGLVNVRHGRRMEIRPPAEWNHLDPLLLELNHDPASVRSTLGDLHELRMLLEPEIAARAAVRANAEQLARVAASRSGGWASSSTTPTSISRSTSTSTASWRPRRGTSCSPSCSTRSASFCG